MEKNDIKIPMEIRVNGELFIKTHLNIKGIKRLEKIIEKLEKGEEVK